jgi:hypothetical protein
MSWLRRLNDFGTQRRGESSRDYLRRMGDARTTGYVPRAVYAELVELHDRVEHLEARLAEQERTSPRPLGS